MSDQTLDDYTRKHLKVFYPLLIVPGIVHVLAPAVVNTMMKQLGLVESLGGLLQIVYFSGVLVGTLMITRLMQRFTVKQILLAQVLVLSASLLAAAASPAYPLILCFYLFTGLANGILITMPGAYVTGVAGEQSPRYQNMLYAFLSLGIVLGPVLPGLIARWNISFRVALVAPGILIIPFAIPLALVEMQRVHEVDRLSVKLIRDVLSFNRALFLGLLMALLLYAAAKSSVSTWLVRFLESGEGVAPGVAHLVLMVVAGLITTGRWLCGYLSKKIDPFNILEVISLASAIVVFVAPLPSSKTASFILYPLLGLVFAGIYPFLLGYAAWFPRAESSAVFTSIIAAGAIGGAIFPYAVGLLNQYVGPKFGMSSVAVLMLGVVACLYWIKPHVFREKPKVDVAGKEVPSDR